MTAAYEDPAVLARVAAILVNTREAAAVDDGPSDQEPRPAPITTRDGNWGVEVGRAS
jgi:hypothetical protein